MARRSDMKAEKPSKSEPATGAAGTPKSGVSEIRRLVIPVDADGRIAADRMRQSTRDQVARLVQDPTTARALGVEADTAETAVPSLVTAMAIQTLSSLDALVIARLSGAPAAIVREHALWTETDQAAIQPAMQAVLDKHVGRWLVGYDAEAALLGGLISVTLLKLQAVREAMAAMRGPARVVPMSAPVDEVPKDGDA